MAVNESTTPTMDVTTTKENLGVFVSHQDIFIIVLCLTSVTLLVLLPIDFLKYHRRKRSTLQIRQGSRPRVYDARVFPFWHRNDIPEEVYLKTLNSPTKSKNRGRIDEEDEFMQLQVDATEKYIDKESPRFIERRTSQGSYHSDIVIATNPLLDSDGPYDDLMSKKLLLKPIKKKKKKKKLTKNAVIKTSSKVSPLYDDVAHQANTNNNPAVTDTSDVANCNDNIGFENDEHHKQNTNAYINKQHNRVLPEQNDLKVREENDPKGIDVIGTKEYEAIQMNPDYAANHNIHARLSNEHQNPNAQSNPSGNTSPHKPNTQFDTNILIKNTDAEHRDVSRVDSGYGGVSTEMKIFTIQNQNPETNILKLDEGSAIV